MNCSIKLIKVECSDLYLEPGQDLFIKCTFEALDDCPVPLPAELFADFEFGHMRKPENLLNKYRATGNIYPQPMHWKKGERWSASVCWHIGPDLWAGTFGVTIGMVDVQTNQPVKFLAKDKEAFKYCIGNIEVDFGAGVDFVKKNNRSWVHELCSVNCTDDLIEDVKPFDFLPEVKVRDIQSDTLILCKANTEQHGNLYMLNTPYIQCDLVYIQGEKSIITLENITEQEGYELIDVQLPVMMGLTYGKLVSVFGNGRLIYSHSAYPWGFEQVYDVRNCAAIYNDNQTIVIETPYLDDKIHQSICERNNRPFAALGATLTYRMRAFGDLKSVEVINTPTVEIYSTQGSWQGAARLLRQSIDKITALYDRAWVYKFWISPGPEHGKPLYAHQFQEVLDVIEKVYHLTSGVKQIVYMIGWQHEGHDTGYPDVFTVNPLAGDLDTLNSCIEKAKEYNAVLSFHDNYDDCYDNAYFDPEIAALDWNGNYFASWIWSSGISRMIGLQKYYRSGKMQERVRKTVERYNIHTSYHIDVLSSEVRRYDYDSNCPIAAQEAFQYKKAVIEEFSKYGLDVTSEALAHPFIGSMGFYWSTRSNDSKLFSSEVRIPFIPMIYHGKVIYNDDLYSLKECAITGAIAGRIDMSGWKDEYLKAFYAQILPMGLLCNETIEDYKTDENERITYFSNNGYAKVSNDTDFIEISVNGRIVTKNGQTFAPGFDDKTFLAYSQGGAFEFDLPQEWCAENSITAHILTDHGIGDSMNVNITNGKIILDLQDNTPVVVINNSLSFGLSV